MSNYFLKVDKELFKTGLTPIEILLVSQIQEFQSNTGDCFISDKVLAENFGVSESTVSRALKGLEAKGYITRSTKNVRGGKERHLKVNPQPTTSKMPVDSGIQASKCLLSTSNLTVDNKQNDLIKDNLKDKEKDNNSFLLPNGNKKGVALPDGKAANSPEPGAELEEISLQALLAMGARYEITEDNLIRIIDTGVLFRIKQ